MLIFAHLGFQVEAGPMEPFAVEGTTEDHLILELLACDKVTNYKVLSSSPGEVVAMLTVRRMNLSVFPACYLPFLITHCAYMKTEVCVDFIKAVAADALPDLATILDGEKLGRKARVRDVKMQRYCKALLDRAQRGRDPLLKWMWEQWSYISGLGLVGNLPRGAPNATKVLGSLTSQFTKEAKIRDR